MRDFQRNRQSPHNAGVEGGLFQWRECRFGVMVIGFRGFTWPSLCGGLLAIHASEGCAKGKRACRVAGGAVDGAFWSRPLPQRHTHSTLPEGQPERTQWKAARCDFFWNFARAMCRLERIYRLACLFLFLSAVGTRQKPKAKAQAR